MNGKSLVQVLTEDQPEELETVELLQNGKLRKFEVLTREWNDEKVGHDLTLRNVVPARNWQTKAKLYQAFEDCQGNINFVKEQ